MSNLGEKYLPPEIIEMILKQVDPRTFINSRRVCKNWLEIVDHIGKDTNYWELQCQKKINSFKNIHEKGSLTWADVYMNSCLWKKIDNACLSKAIIEGLESLDVPIRDINVSDGELHITLKNKIVKYCLSTSKINNIINGEYLSYVENNYMAAVHSFTNILYVIPKRNDIYPQNKIVIDNVEKFKISVNKCYYLTTHQHFCVRYLKSNIVSEPEILSKWYNSDRIRDMHLHNDNVYFLTESGKYLIYESNRIKQINTFLWPRNDYMTFEKFYLCRGGNFLYCNDAYFYVQLENGDSAVHEGVRQITSVLLHSDILIIGTYWGEVMIYTITSMSDLLTLNLSKPLDRHSLSNEVSQPISGFDIFEEPGCHTLFIRTRSNIFKVKYDHLSSKNVDPTDVNCKLSKFIF